MALLAPVLGVGAAPAPLDVVRNPPTGPTFKLVMGPDTYLACSPLFVRCSPIAASPVFYRGNPGNGDCSAGRSLLLRILSPHVRSRH